MGEGIVLGRIGHYFDAGNGSCSTALVVETVPGLEPGQSGVITVKAWHHGGEEFTRTSVPVVGTPAASDSANSFHLNRSCPWGR